MRTIKSIHRPGKLERWYQRMRFLFSRYDLERLVDVCLLGVVFVWFVYLMIFKDVMP